MDTLKGNEFVDISTFLPKLVSLCGIRQAKRTLRDFTQEEAEKIAYGNMERILSL